MPQQIALPMLANLHFNQLLWYAASKLSVMVVLPAVQKMLYLEYRAPTYVTMSEMSILLLLGYYSLTIPPISVIQRIRCAPLQRDSSSVAFKPSDLWK